MTTEKISGMTDIVTASPTDIHEVSKRSGSGPYTWTTYKESNEELGRCILDNTNKTTRIVSASSSISTTLDNNNILEFTNSTPASCYVFNNSPTDPVLNWETTVFNNGTSTVTIASSGSPFISVQNAPNSDIVLAAGDIVTLRYMETRVIDTHQWYFWWVSGNVSSRYLYTTQEMGAPIAYFDDYDTYSGGVDVIIGPYEGKVRIKDGAVRTFNAAAPAQYYFNPNTGVTKTGATTSDTVIVGNLGSWKIALSDNTGKLVSSTASDVEASYLAGVTSNIQTQFTGKADYIATSANATFTGPFADQVKSVKYTKVGKTVTIEMSAPFAAADGSGGLIITASGTVPAAYRPVNDWLQVVQIRDLNTNTFGIFAVNADGTMAAGLAGFGGFGAIGDVGVQADHISFTYMAA